MNKLWHVYIIRTEKNKLYTGITTDLERRFQEHCEGKKGAKYFRSDPPKKIVFYGICPNRSVASKHEADIKKKSTVYKKKLVDSFNKYGAVCYIV